MKRALLHAQRGLAAVEFALLLPILLMLLFGMIDAARALQANIIITNISREGANLVARGNTELDTGSQQIINALMASAPPLNVNQQGMMYITRVMGVVKNGVNSSVVLDQYRWDDKNYEPASKVYRCKTWSGAGKCTGFSSTSRPVVDVMKGKLDDGEVVHVVETFYQYDMLLTGAATGALRLPTIGPDLYSMTIF